MVRRECFQDTFFLHDDKTRAVGQAPFFVQPLLIQRPAFFAQFVTERNDADDASAQGVQRRNGFRANVRRSQRVSDFQKNKLRRHKRNAPLDERAIDCLRAGVQRVGSVEQRNPRSGVNKNLYQRSPRLGMP